MATKNLSPLATAPVSAAHRAGATFLALWIALSLAYALWLVAFWPGVLGDDSVEILSEVEQDGFRSGKTVFWYYFVRLFYEGARLVEAPVAAMLLLCALVFARILAWCWGAGLRKSCVFVLMFIALTPHMVVFMGTLSPDGAFGVAVCGLLFELWLGMRQRRMYAASLAMVAVTLPFAAFGRPDGMVYLLPAAAVLLFVDGRSRLWLAAIIAVWCALLFAGARTHPAKTQEAFYPLAVFETVNVLRPRAKNELWTRFAHLNDPWVLAEPKLSSATLEVLQRHRPVGTVFAYSDPAYGDMLVFHPEGPQMAGLPESDRRLLVREFFRYNLWHNLPDFVASRVNVFLSSALAQGGFPAVTYATHALSRTQSVSTYRRFDVQELERAFIAIQKASYEWRWLLWTPWLGFALLAWALVRGVRRREAALLVIALPMAAQLGAIFLLSTAGEYRYLLPFFVLPVVLLPAFALRHCAPASPLSA